MEPLVGNICTIGTNLITNGTIGKEIGGNGKNGNAIGTNGTNVTNQWCRTHAISCRRQLDVFPNADDPFTRGFVKSSIVRLYILQVGPT